MGVIKIDDMRDQVEELVSRAEAGETILIEKDGKTVARLVGTNVASRDREPKKKIDITALQEFTRSQPLQSESAGDFIRRMRDEDRY
ncbi:type II toxin-antitoxin system Phd/YefM family antitoxin [Rhizobium sp. LjRoot254]|uniref:type II toxin-antitoxin system Phd/YefM family antitoxin n=1 Tax=Rhizobium sp. LjRoot254 TaxID=3342297 RepID=UPI003ED0D802